MAPDPLADTTVLGLERESDRLPRRASTFVAALFASDFAAIGGALLVAHVARFGLADPRVFRGFSSLVVSALIGMGWVASLFLQGAYEPRFLGVGGEEYRRLTRATFLVFAMLAIGSYLLKIEVARGFVGIAFPVGLLLLLVGRFACRQWLVRQRAVGKLCQQVLVIGDRLSVVDFVAQLRQEPSAGFRVVGACLPDKGEQMRRSDRVDVRAVGHQNRKFVWRRSLDDATEGREQLAHDRDVSDVRNIGEAVFPGGEETGRHLLEHRVLGAEGLDLAFEGADGFHDQ